MLIPSPNYRKIQNKKHSHNQITINTIRTNFAEWAFRDCNNKAMNKLQFNETCLGYVRPEFIYRDIYGDSFSHNSR